MTKAITVRLIGSVLIPLSLSSAECIAPPLALERLQSYLSYESTTGWIRAGENRFGFAEIDDADLFFQYAPSQYVGQSERRVYVLSQGKPIFPTACPENSEWVRCAEVSFQQFYRRELADQPALPVKLMCDLSINVPQWRPSPNDAQKRELASDVLKELINSGYHDAKEIYARDFNVHDPKLEFLIIDRNGHEAVQGCDFDAEKTPHCAWHLFGQAPIKQLKKQIMARPYSIFPEK